MINDTYLNLLAQNGINGAHPGGMALTSHLLRREQITPNMSLLDVGCGTGQTAAYIATHHPCKIVAVDINPQMLEKAHQKIDKYHLGVTLLHADAMKLPFQKNSFDLVLTESVTAFTEIRRTLKEYCRVLKPSGTVLAIEVTAASPLSGTILKDLQKIIGISYLPTMKEWCQMFHDSGFSNVQVLYYKKNNWFESFPPAMYRIFRDYISVIYRHRFHLGFGVYRCNNSSLPM